MFFILYKDLDMNRKGSERELHVILFYFNSNCMNTMLIMFIVEPVGDFRNRSNDR